jgi:hypothetical protein
VKISNSPKSSNIIRFTSQIREIVDFNQAGTNIKAILKRQLENRFMNYWYAKVNTEFSTRKGQGNKLRTYKLFKREFKFETYLSDIKNKTLRKKLTQFRISAHTLKIETDRFDSKGKYKAPDERICTNCTLNKTEDEEHFVTECTKYEVIRKELYREVNRINAHFTTYSQKNKFLWLMSNEEVKIQESLAKYLKESMDMRKRSSQ